MGRTLIRHFHRKWRLVAFACYVAANVPLALLTVLAMPFELDWQLWARLPAAIASGTLYQVSADELPFLWSPLMAPVMAGMTWIGFWPWAAFHVAAVALLRDWRLVALTLVSFAFWTDVAGANTFAFIFVAGTLAMRGNRWASLIYLALFLLMPRPVQLPLAVWLLWKTPESRGPFGAMFAVHALAVLFTGYAGDWLAAMTGYGIEPTWNLGPTASVGLWWFIVAVPLAVWLTRKGYVGLAGLLLSPYLVIQYLLMPLVDVAYRARRSPPSLDPVPDDVGVTRPVVAQ